MTTIDYPDRLAAVLFLQGCPWRCPYCHNRGFQALGAAPARDWDEATAFLARRRGLLDAVVFSGGEPTLHAGLGEAARQVRAMGFLVGLHTNGGRPDRLAGLVERGLVDWVGLDVKAPRRLYREVTGGAATADAVWQSLGLILQAGVACQLRLTVWRPALDDAAVLELARELRAAGATALTLQPWREASSDGSLRPDAALRELQRRVDAILSNAAQAEPAKRATGVPPLVVPALPPAHSYAFA